MKIEIGIDELITTYLQTDDVYLCHVIISTWYDWLASSIITDEEQITYQLREFVFWELRDSGLLGTKGDTAVSWIVSDLNDRDLRVFMLDQIKLANPLAKLTITLGRK